MKISYKRLKHYINDLPSPEELSVLLTDCGLEVENIEYYSSITGGLKGFIIGEVLSKEKHPDADRLSVCKVTTGNNAEFNVVCGANNVEKGQKILFAPIGTKVYKDDESFTIKKSKIRGVVSEGMICAEDEAGLGSSHEGILVLPETAQAGTPASEYFNVFEDVVFEIGLTPNRVDAASHIGVARDIAAVLSLNAFLKNKKENYTPVHVNIPDVDSFSAHNNDLNIDIEIKNENCIRYSGLTISDVKVAESPEWLQNELKAIGIRPINNIVDITNFVLFETGQPLHAFDANKIKGQKVIIKTLTDKTNFVTLDEVTRVLSSDDLMICNVEEPMCIAGVFGGLNSGISDSTVSVFLESACFAPSSIRKTSKRHSLKTDASFRYERGSDPEITIYALKRAANLISDIAGGHISSEINDLYPNPVKPVEVYLSFNNLKKLAGIDIDKNIVKLILEALNIVVKQADEQGLLLSIPQFKNDVTREADVIEEVLRIYGYNKIPLTGRINASLSHNIEGASEKRKKIIASFLIANGFNEIMCNSLSSQSYYENNNVFNINDCVKIMNPLSKDLSVMRQTLLYGGLETIEYNQNRKMPDLKLFEFGNVYKLSEYYDNNKSVTDNYIQHEMLALFLTGKKQAENWYIPSTKIDFFYLKAFLNNIFKRIGININSFETDNAVSEIFAEGVSLCKSGDKIVEYGEVNANIIKNAGIKDTVFYAAINWNKIVEFSAFDNYIIKDLPKFPEVKRDLALVIDKNVKYSDIEKNVYKTAKPLLKNISLFDVYEGDKIESDKKSYAIRLILEDKEKTLTDEIINATIEKIIFSLSKDLGAKLR